MSSSALWVKLVRYLPKDPPVAVAPVSIVTNVEKFIEAYLRDLSHRLKHPGTHACAPVSEILAKLAEVGLELEILSPSEMARSERQPGTIGGQVNQQRPS
jgi:hypothetical protein